MATAILERNRGKRKKTDGVQLRRKNTLFRKCYELTVKSDVQVSLLCIGSDGEIETWPNLEKVKAMFTMHREERADQKNGEIKEDKSESEGKEKPANNSGKLSAESLMTLLRDLDSKLENLDGKIKMLSTQKATDFCRSSANNSESFKEVYGWDDLSRDTIESYGQPWGSTCCVQPNQPTKFTEESMAVSADIDYSVINRAGVKRRWVPHNPENFALNPNWEPQIELLGNDMNGAQASTVTGQDDIGALQNHCFGSYWDHLRLQW